MGPWGGRCNWCQIGVSNLVLEHYSTTESKYKVFFFIYECFTLNSLIKYISQLGQTC